MGKGTGVGSIVFGVIMILLGIGAYFSGEASSQTDQGRMAIGIVILLGLALIYGGVSARGKAAAKPQTVPAQAPQAAPPADIPSPPPPDAPGVFCQSCGRQIQADFRVCPFCGKPTKPTCSKCGKQVEQEFALCPYCGTSLKSAQTGP